MRRNLARAAVVLTAALAGMLAGAPLALSSAAAVPLPGTGQPTRPEIFQDLGVDSKVPAAYVILVDTSSSMQQSGLYPQVISALPGFIESLGSGDLVAVFNFDTTPENVPTGLVPPSLSVLDRLPPEAKGEWTDFGHAFAKALSLLQTAPAEVHVGGIILLSDGLIDAPNDPAFAKLSSSGWTGQIQTVRNLSARMTITGYAIQLGDPPLTPGSCTRAQTTDVRTCAGVSVVLGKLLTPLDVDTLSPDSDIAAILGQAKTATRIAKAAQVLRSDLGRPVTATITGADGRDLRRLDLRSGSAPLLVTFVSHAPDIPAVSVTGLRVRVDGFPARVTGLPSKVTLGPLDARTVTARLVWRSPARSSLTGGTGTGAGRLRLTGTVTSPWVAAIRDDLNDGGFRLGPLSAGQAAFAGTYPEPVAAAAWMLLAALVLLAASAAAGLLAYRFPRLSGRLLVVDLVADADIDNGVREAGRDVLLLKGRRMRIDLREKVRLEGTALVKGNRDGSLRITVTRPVVGRPKTGVTRHRKLVRASVGFRHLPG